MNEPQDDIPPGPYVGGYVCVVSTKNEGRWYSHLGTDLKKAQEWLDRAANLIEHNAGGGYYGNGTSSRPVTFHNIIGREAYHWVEHASGTACLKLFPHTVVLASDQIISMELMHVTESRQTAKEKM